MPNNIPDKFPWEVDAALLPERLQLLAVKAMTARNEVIDRVGKRDDSWCTGCRAYSWVCSALSELSEGGANPWLRTERSGLIFTIYIDQVPVKFYRGNAGDPKVNTLRSGVRAMMAQSRMAFLEEEIGRETEGWFWLLAIETDVEGRVLEIIALQANIGGEVRYPWSVPLDGRVVAIADITDVRREGVDLPEPEIGVPGDETMEATEGDGTADDDGDGI